MNMFLKLNKEPSSIWSLISRPQDVDLYKDGDLLPYDPQGTIYCGVDYMEIQEVDCSDARKYKISTRNTAGEGHISFRLKVKGISTYAYIVSRVD